MTAIKNMRTVWEGGDPTEDRVKSTVPIFSEAAETVISINRDSWRGDDSERQWR